MGFLLWEEGSGKQDLRVVIDWSFLFQVFCEIAACVNLSVTLKGSRGEENASVAVEESCMLDIKSGTVLIISSGLVLVFNCSLKARYLLGNSKYPLAFSSFRRSFPESKSSMLPAISFRAKEVRQAKDFAAVDILKALEEYLFETLRG